MNDSKCNQKCVIKIIEPFGIQETNTQTKTINKSSDTVCCNNSENKIINKSCDTVCCNNLENKITNNNNTKKRSAKDLLLKRTSLIIIGALTLVASLSWNEAISSLFRGPCDSEDAGVFCNFGDWGPWIYAISITIFTIIVAYLIIWYTGFDDI